METQLLPQKRIKILVARFFETPERRSEYFRCIFKNDTRAENPPAQRDPASEERNKRIEDCPEDQLVRDTLLVSRTFFVPGDGTASAYDKKMMLPDTPSEMMQMRDALVAVYRAVTTTPGSQMLTALFRAAGYRKRWAKYLRVFVLTRVPALIAKVNALLAEEKSAG